MLSECDCFGVDRKPGRRSPGLLTQFWTAPLSTSSSPTSSQTFFDSFAMLTSRGVTRLSRRAVKNAKKTNAFFSSAVLASRASLPAQAAQLSTPQQGRSTAPQPGMCQSYHACSRTQWRLNEHFIHSILIFRHVQFVHMQPRLKA